MATSEGPCGRRFRILQIHPTRRCNLRCRHCYSLSGPEQRDELAVDALRDAITDASSAGYEIAGFSGGEPLLYEPLPTLLRHAQDRGMFTTVTTNGMHFSSRRLDILRGCLNLVAVSLDGVPASHNRLRASERAFDTMEAKLPLLRQSGIPFGFIFTLTRHNLHELDWVANFALGQGARLLQIHPLESVGRAALEMGSDRPDEVEDAYAYLETMRLQETIGGRMYIQLDLFDRDAILAEPSRVFASEDSAEPQSELLADLVSPLVIEPDGTVAPIRYGFAREFVLGNLKTNRLPRLARTWVADRYPAFRDLCRRVFATVSRPAELPFFNWYEVVANG